MMLTKKIMTDTRVLPVHENANHARPNAQLKQECHTERAFTVSDLCMTAFANPHTKGLCVKQNGHFIVSFFIATQGGRFTACL
jgi:hypothetical protein